jgi:hypothetical protein
MRSSAKLALSTLSLLVACSSSSSSSSPGDAAASSNAITCGSGALKGQAHLTDPTSLGPVVGATVTAPGCTSGTTDDRGFIAFASDPGVLVKISLKASGYLDEYGEVTILKDGFLANTFQFLATTKSTIFTGWTDANGYIAVVTGGDGSDGGACSDGKGTTLSIKGHPEVQVGYLSDPKTRSSTLTASAGFGAVLGPLPPGMYEIVGTKAGCKTVGQNDGSVSFGTTTTVFAGTLTGHALMLAPQ